MKKLILKDVKLRDTLGKIFYTGLIRVEYLTYMGDIALQIVNTKWEDGEANKNWIGFLDSWTKLEILRRIKEEA